MRFDSQNTISMKTTRLLLCLLVGLACQQLHSQIVAGPLTNAANGHWYYAVGPTFWTNAEAQAVGLGGHLVTLNDAAENAWVLESFGNFRELFIGLTDEGHEGQWSWTSDEPVTYLNWNDGEPNNGGGGFPYENLGSMYGRPDARAGFWNDLIGSLAEQQSWGVVEVAPRLAIRVSQVELCWPTATGVVYQLQYQSPLTTNLWGNLGPPVSGTGAAVCRLDSVLPNEPQRLYRVIAVP